MRMIGNNILQIIMHVTQYLQNALFNGRTGINDVKIIGSAIQGISIASELNFQTKLSTFFFLFFLSNKVYPFLDKIK